MRTKAKFDNQTKEIILNRDWYRCALCWNIDALDIHHVYYWLQSNTNTNRNDQDQWVTLCRNCHNDSHSCKSWHWVRQEAIDYLNSL